MFFAGGTPQKKLHFSNSIGRRVEPQLFLRIMIASPILHVPVTLGTAIFSLGELPLGPGPRCPLLEEVTRGISGVSGYN